MLIPDDLKILHSRFEGSVRWCVDVDGVHVEDGSAERTKGEPMTMRRIWASYQEPLTYYADAYDVPVELLLATAATETRGNPDAVREEPGYVSDEATPHRVSPGLCQTLISTAREALRDPSVGRAFLLRPEGSIQACGAYLASQRRLTAYDPPLVAAAYNAGGLYHDRAPANRWRLRCYPLGTGEHVDRFVRWYGDAVAVVSI